MADRSMLEAVVNYTGKSKTWTCSVAELRDLLAENERLREEIDTMRAIWRTHKCSARPGASVGQCIDDYGCNCSCGLFIPRESRP